MRPVAEGKVPRDVCVRPRPLRQVRTLNLFPPLFIVLLIDLSRLECGVGLMIHTSAGLMSRKP